MTRLRDFGLTPGTVPPGPHNAITDVPGVRVGHSTIIRGEGALVPGEGPARTGVTAIVPHGGNLFTEKLLAAVFTINGFGKVMGFEQVRELGTLETPILLTNTLNVPLAADALISYLIQQNPLIGINTFGTVNPLVGETNDGFLNDIQGRHVRQEHVFAALDGATGGPVTEGCVGAGTGTGCFGFKGGIGTASRHLAHEQLPASGLTLGALVQTNFGNRAELMVCGVPVGEQLKDTLLPERGTPGPGSIMVALATDAPLTARQLERVAKRAAHGIARTGGTSHHGSGDFVIAFSTANRIPVQPEAPIAPLDMLHDQYISALFTMAAEVVEEAILNSLLAAETTVGRDGNTLHALPHEALSDLLRQEGSAGVPGQS